MRIERALTGVVKLCVLLALSLAIREAVERHRAPRPLVLITAAQP